MMPGDPKDILGKLRDDDYLREFIDKSQTGVTGEINQTRVAAELLLARTIADQAEGLGKTLVEQTSELTRVIGAHVEALVKASQAGEQHARSLKWAAWALFLATIVLAAIAAIQLYSQLQS